MDFRKLNAPTNTISHDINAMSEEVGNVYEMVTIIAKRANQINVEIKSEIEKNCRILVDHLIIEEVLKIVNR